MSFPYQSKDEIDAVVRGFESCTTSKTGFPHQSHLTVATWYVYEFTLEQAMDKMRAGLLRLIEHHGVDPEKYNETLTVFWLKMIEKQVNQLDSDLSLIEVTNAVINALGNSSLVFEYYSPELLKSQAAKKKWIEPDLKPFRE